MPAASRTRWGSRATTHSTRTPLVAINAATSPVPRRARGPFGSWLESSRTRFRFGADDYVVKPFSIGELAGRVAAVVRRASPRPVPAELQCGPSTVTEHIGRVRHRIEQDPDRPRWIRTVRGVGYSFEP